jgi:hypothetical protein
MGDNTATLEGYTREIEATNAHGCTFFLLVKPDADLSGVFKAWDIDEQEWCYPKGWLFSIEEKVAR